MNVLEPLAFRIRPNNLDEVVGQEALVGPNGFLRKSVEKKALFSLILFGNPGTGKTTIAEAYAKTLKVHFVSLNAVTTSKKEMEAAVEEAKLWHPCILIVDEVHARVLGIGRRLQLVGHQLVVPLHFVGGFIVKHGGGEFVSVRSCPLNAPVGVRQ